MRKLAPRLQGPVKTSLAALSLVVALALASPARAQDAPEAQDADTLDAAMLRVSNELPEFGGVFRDSDGALTVYLTNPAQKDRAQEALGRVLGLPIAARDIRVKQGRYGFAELSLYRTMVQPALTMKGVTLTDLDEAGNKVTVGVETRAFAQVVRADLMKYGVPADALDVVVTGPIHRLLTLRSRIRPVVGGLQINFGNYLCTDGFMATRAGVRGFVTNSHCTGRQGGVTSTVYYQPTRSTASSRIGVEIADPAFRSGGACPGGYRCRWSDSAFVRFDSGVASQKGHIARPTGLGSLTISGTTPRFRIAGETGAPLSGETLNKVGRTTGWSRGRVSMTCATVAVSGTSFALFCQDIVTARVAAGDSGSPVFKVVGSPDRVRLYGILWGGNSAGTLFVFSRFANIQRELGTLSTCDPALAGC